MFLISPLFFCNSGEARSSVPPTTPMRELNTPSDHHSQGSRPMSHQGSRPITSQSSRPMTVPITPRTVARQNSTPTLPPIGANKSRMSSAAGQ